MKKIFKTIGIVILVLLSQSHQVQARQYPEPINYVSDFAGIIDDQDEAEMNLSLKSLEKTSTFQVAVVTLKSLEENIIENVAVELFDQWGIGTKEKDNGLLLLVAPTEKKVRIEVGYGLEPIITDSQAGTIIRNVIIPRFKENNYNQGIVDGTKVIEKALLKDPTAFENTKASVSGEDTLNLMIFGAVMLMYLSSFLSRSKRYWPGGVIGFIFGIILGTLVTGIVIGILGLLFDYLLSKNYRDRKSKGLPVSWWASRGGFSSKGSGFGGFSGGSSGGGGASGGW